MKLDNTVLLYLWEALAGVAVAAAVPLAIRWLRKWAAASDLARLIEVGNIKDALRAAAFATVTALERQEGKGTGSLKLAQAVHELWQLVPEKYRGQFDAQAITDIVEDALAAAKLKWAKNPALLQQGQSTKAIGFMASTDETE